MYNIHRYVYCMHEMIRFTKNSNKLSQENICIGIKHFIWIGANISLQAMNISPPFQRHYAQILSSFGSAITLHWV